MLEIRISTFPLIVGATALGLYASKPPISSFKPFFKNWLEERLKHNSAEDQGGLLAKLRNMTEWAISNLVANMTEPTIQDYYVCLLATVQLQNVTLHFLGAASRWWIVMSEPVAGAGDPQQPNLPQSPNRR